MRQDIPQDVWTKVVIGFIFSFFIIWYFSFRLIISFILPFLPSIPIAYLTAVFSFMICLLLVKRTIEIEMKNPEIPVSIVARDPEVEVEYEQIRTKSSLNKFVYSILFTLLLGLPFILISVVKIFSGENSVTEIAISFLEGYWVIFIICFLISLFISFVFIPSLKGWHWTKHQF